jgi:hypothetical protein
MMAIFQLKNFLLCSAVMILLAPGVCLAEESPEKKPPIEFGAELDSNTLYIWRGFALSRDAVLQPSAFVSIHNVTLSSWANFEINPALGKRHLNETDLAISYCKDWRNISIEPSVQAYLFPRDVESPNTTEIILKIRYPIKSLGVFTRHAYDVDSYRGAYFAEAGLDWQKEFGRDLKLSTSASAGWGGVQFNAGYFGWAKRALNVVSLDTILSWQVSKKFLIRQHINLSSLVDPHLRKLVEKPDLRNVGFDIVFNY